MELERGFATIKQAPEAVLVPKTYTSSRERIEPVNLAERLGYPRPFSHG